MKKIKIVGYAKHQDPPHIIINIPLNLEDKVFEIAETNPSELQEYDIFLTDSMMDTLRNLLEVWITDIDIKDNNWLLE